MSTIYIRTGGELIDVLENYKDTPITITINNEEHVITSVSCETTYTDPVEVHLTLNAGNVVLGNLVK